MDITKLKNITENCELQGEKVIVRSNILETISFVKDYYSFDMLKEIVAVDNGDNSIELQYKMYSTENEEDLIISTFVKDTAESVSKIFDSAIADEKEIYDMFGVKFLGNDELKRLYMPENWDGNPLKKDYEENDKRLEWND